MAELFLRTKIGDIVLDAELREAHTSDLRITDNPVESGAAVSDHAVLEPKTVRIEGVIVDYEPIEQELGGIEGLAPRGTDDFLSLLPMATDFSAVTAQTKAYATRALTSYMPTAQSSALAQVRAIAPWLPGGAAIGSDQSGTGSRLQRIYDSLLALQKSGQTIDIQTGLKLYKSMLLPSISADEDQRGSLRVSITARELLVVETKVVAGVSVATAGNDKSGRAGAQSAAKSSKGNTNPPETNKSALSTVGGLFK